MFPLWKTWSPVQDINNNNIVIGHLDIVSARDYLNTETTSQMADEKGLLNILVSSKIKDEILFYNPNKIV